MLNPRDLDVLNIMWKKHEPMMATDIVNSKLGLTQSTVTTVLRKLLNEKLVEVAGITHSGRVLSRVYVPTSKSREMILQQYLEKYIDFSQTINEASLCFSLLTDGKEPEKAKNEIHKLMLLLSEYEDAILAEDSRGGNTYE